MDKLKKLRAKLAQVQNDGRKALDAYNALLAKDTRDDAEETRLAALDADVTRLETEAEKIKAEVEAAEKAERRATLFAPARSPAGSYAVNDRNPATTGNFASIAEFALSVQRADLGLGVDDRLLATTPQGTMQNGGAAGEGFLVPAQFREEIWENVFEAGTVLTAVSPEPTNSNAVNFTKDETTPWGAAGVRAYWGNESGLYTASKAELKAGLVELHKLYAFVEATDELLADAPRLADRLTRKAGDAIRFAASESIVNGNGSGKPQGWAGSAAKVSVAKESGQLADTINVTNLAKMVARAVPGPGMFWHANQDILPALITLQIGNQPAFVPMNQGIVGQVGGFLFGRPIIFTEHAQTLGDEGDIELINPAGYYAVTKTSGIEFAQSMHLYFDRGVQAFRWTFRLGGQPAMSAPITRKNGGNTLSHFVRLADRA